MLHLNRKHSFHLPHIDRQLAFVPVPSEDDDLIREIEEKAHGEQWTLNPLPDCHELAEFWSGVERELKADPLWFQDDE